VRQDAVTHDVVLTCGQGPKRRFRIFGRPMPGNGDTIALPLDGRLISAPVTDRSDKRIEQSMDAELVE
jgi:hypothetical protein